MDSLLEHDEDFKHAPWGPLGRDVTLGLVSAASKFVLQALNNTKVLNHAGFLDLVYNRPDGVGLLTICNHTSTFDDPGLPCAMLPWHFFWTEHAHGKNRWTMCASDICFTNEIFRQFFLNGKTLPIERGAGVAQPMMGVAGRLLGGGAWLHIFPEGRVTPDGHLGPFRQGIGRLVCDARAAAAGRDPIILPYYHSGMARVMPFKAMLPRAGTQVVVAVGQPLNLAHITCRCNQPGEDQQQVWRDIASALWEAVQQLENQVPPNPNQMQERPDVALYEQQYQQRVQQRRTNGKQLLLVPPPPQQQHGQQQQQQHQHQQHQHQEQEQQQQQQQHHWLHERHVCESISAGGGHAAGVSNSVNTKDHQSVGQLMLAAAFWKHGGG